MLSKFLTPIPPALYFIFGEPKDSLPVYEQEGTFTYAQAWYRALRRVVGDVVPLSEVSLFVPVSRNAIHSRVKEGKLSVFKFKINATDSDESPSLKRERPHAFVPVTECLFWYQEYHDRLVMRENKLPPGCSARELYYEYSQTSFDHYSKQHEDTWKEALEAFQQEYTVHTFNKAIRNIPEKFRKQHETNPNYRD